MNLLDYFRIPDKTPKTKAKFLVSYFGKTKINKFQKAASDPVLLDIMHLIYLDLGSPVEVEKMLLSLEQIEKEVRVIENKDTIKMNKSKKE